MKLPWTRPLALVLAALIGLWGVLLIGKRLSRPVIATAIRSSGGATAEQRASAIRELLSDHRPVEAAEYGRNAVTAFPSDPDLRLLLADALLASRQEPELPGVLSGATTE